MQTFFHGFRLYPHTSVCVHIESEAENTAFPIHFKGNPCGTAATVADACGDDFRRSARLFGRSGPRHAATCFGNLTLAQQSELHNSALHKWVVLTTPTSLAVQSPHNPFCLLSLQFRVWSECSFMPLCSSGLC